MNRLDTSAPTLAQRLREADRRTQRAAAVTAASWAVSVAQLDQVSVGRALELLQQGDHRLVVKDELVEAVEQLDELGWSIQEIADDGVVSVGDYLEAFGRARAAAAVLFAADLDSEVAALEATYEASVVASDNAALIAAVEAVLAAA